MVEVVAALIWKSGKFLICQRPENKARGLKWEFVGGKKEEGETLEEALIRECKEELDILVAPKSVFYEVTHEYPDITIRLTLFECELVQGEPKLYEHNAIMWVTPEEAQKYDFCPADIPILEKIAKQY